MAEKLTETQNGSGSGKATCRHCGGPLKRQGATGRIQTDFCSKRCTTAWWSMARRRGGQVYKELIDWRTSRGKKKGALANIAHIVDGWIAEDKGCDRDNQID